MEKPKDKVLKILCSLEYFLQWIVFSGFSGLDPACVVIDVQINQVIILVKGSL